MTTGVVAQILKVAPRTVSKWFDAGKLRGYQIPGSQARRVPRENLIEFMREYKMPMALLEEWDAQHAIADDNHAEPAASH
jgi:excisionase family DNA binding protein